MIRDVIIIKDGIPLLSKNFSNSQNSLFSQDSNLVMISGFFSALNSFSEYEDLGSIHEIALSNIDFKLSFFKEPSIPNLIYLASFDEKSQGVNVQRTLRKISKDFLKKYNFNQITNWTGRLDAFEEFEEIIKGYVDEEKNENESQFKNKVIKLFDDIKDEIDKDNLSEKEIKIESDDSPNYYYFIPSFKISKKLNPEDYLTGESSIQVFNQINGKRTIEQIAKDLNINQERVFCISKNLVKLGFVKFLDY